MAMTRGSRVKARDEGRRDGREGDGAEAHDGGAEGDAEDAGATRGVARADGVADAHGRRPADAEGAHEGEARQADGDLVRRRHLGPERAREQRDEREDAHLGEQLEAHGQTQAVHAAEGTGGPGSRLR